MGRIYGRTNGRTDWPTEETRRAESGRNEPTSKDVDGTDDATARGTDPCYSLADRFVGRQRSWKALRLPVCLSRTDTDWKSSVELQTDGEEEKAETRRKRINYYIAFIQRLELELQTFFFRGKIERDRPRSCASTRNFTQRPVEGLPAREATRRSVSPSVSQRIPRTELIRYCRPMSFRMNEIDRSLGGSVGRSVRKLEPPKLLSTN